MPIEYTDFTANILVMIVVLLLVITLTGIYFSRKENIRVILSFLFVLGLIVSTVGLFLALGNPRPIVSYTAMTLPKKAEIVAHIVDREKGKVYVWMVDAEEGADKRPIYVTFPYSDKLVKRLKKAEGAKKSAKGKGKIMYRYRMQRNQKRSDEKGRPDMSLDDMADIYYEDELPKPPPLKDEEPAPIVIGNDK